MACKQWPLDGPQTSRERICPSYLLEIADDRILWGELPLRIFDDASLGAAYLDDLLAQKAPRAFALSVPAELLDVDREAMAEALGLLAYSEELVAILGFSHDNDRFLFADCDLVEPAWVEHDRAEATFVAVARGVAERWRAAQPGVTPEWNSRRICAGAL